MIEIDGEAVLEGLFALFKQYPALRAGKMAATASEESAAIALLMALAQGDWSVWESADSAAHDTARTLLMDFFAKIMMQHPQYKGRRWQVLPGSAQAQALSAMMQEIARAHPAQTKPH